MKKILIGIYVILMLGCMTAYACLSEPQFYELTGDVSIQVSANTSIILKGIKTAPQIKSVKTFEGKDFLNLKIIMGVDWFEETRNIFQRMANTAPYGRTPVLKKNWTKIDLSYNEKQQFPINLILDVESDMKNYKISLLYRGPTDTLKGCSSNN